MNLKLIIAAVTLTSVFTACKKDLTCECTTTNSSSFTDAQGVYTSYESDPQTTTTTYKEVKKSKLGTVCGDSVQESNSTNTNNGSTTYNSHKSETKCQIK